MTRRPRSWRPFLIAIAALAAGAAAYSLAHGDRPSRSGQAILAGEAQGEIDVQRVSDDPNLSTDEELAGALWGKAHPHQTCPSEPKAFHRGCEGL